MKANKNLILGIVAAVVIVAAIVVTKLKPAPTEPAAPVAEKTEAAAPATPSAPETGAPATELKIEDIQVGSGATAEPGKMVVVHYTGWLTNGTKFDSSLDRGQPFPVRLSKPGVSEPQVIQGWDKGLVGMKVGGKRRLTIPADLAYGSRQVGPIPPNSTLIFEVQLISVAD